MSGMLRRSLLALGLAFAAPAAAQDPRIELLFVDKSGCPWCARFEQEVLPGYPQSDIGRTAPLRRVSLDNGQPKEAALGEPVRFTPTFILLRDGKEAGRIVGYMDNGTFYGLMEKLLADNARKPETAK
jgi:thioredoxin-related protein